MFVLPEEQTIKPGNLPKNSALSESGGHWIYEGWNFNSGNYLFTTDTK